jgi:hypothetical protein
MQERATCISSTAAADPARLVPVSAHCQRADCRASLLTQIPDLTTQPAQLITLGGREAVAAPAGVEVSALDPLADRGLGQVEPSGDLADRLASHADQLDDFSLVLRREEPSGP